MSHNCHLENTALHSTTVLTNMAQFEWKYNALHDGAECTDNAVGAVMLHNFIIGYPALYRHWYNHPVLEWHRVFAAFMNIHRQLIWNVVHNNDGKSYL